jgi:hypothetical protein
MVFSKSMSIYQQIVYHRLMNTFGSKTAAPTGPSPVASKSSSAKPQGNSLLQKDWGRQKGQTHA